MDALPRLRRAPLGEAPLPLSERRWGPSPRPGAAAPPEVTKVEPPSWWPGHSIDPVRLLVRGQNLDVYSEHM